MTPSRARHDIARNSVPANSEFLKGTGLKGCFIIFGLWIKGFEFFFDLISERNGG